jgi:hypothetical protein
MQGIVRKKLTDSLRRTGCFTGEECRGLVWLVGWLVGWLGTRSSYRFGLVVMWAFLLTRV